LKKHDAKVFAESYKDRGIGTSDEVLSAKGYMEASGYYAEKLSQKSSGVRMETSARNWADMLLSYYFLARSELIRMLFLSFMRVVDYDDVFGAPVFALKCIFYSSKANKYGRMESAGCLRHKDIEICPIAWLTIYFFIR
jgi:hypothetical protein